MIRAIRAWLTRPSRQELDDALIELEHLRHDRAELIRMLFEANDG